MQAVRYNNWSIERTYDGDEIVWECTHQSSKVPYSFYDFTFEEVKEWIDEQNEKAKEFENE